MDDSVEIDTDKIKRYYNKIGRYWIFIYIGVLILFFGYLLITPPGDDVYVGVDGVVRPVDNVNNSRYNYEFNYAQNLDRICDGIKSRHVPVCIFALVLICFRNIVLYLKQRYSKEYPMWDVLYSIIHDVSEGVCYVLMLYLIYMFWWV